MNLSTLCIQTSLIFYILAVAFFCAFCVVLLWYLISEKHNKNNIQTKSWTIESAKKFLENNNINIKESSNEKVVEAKKSEILGDANKLQTANKSKINAETKHAHTNASAIKNINATPSTKNVNANKTVQRKPVLNKPKKTETKTLPKKSNENNSQPANKIENK